MSSNNIQVPLNNYRINNYTLEFNDGRHLYKPGVVLMTQNTKEDIQNRQLFQYSIPKIENASCLNVDMRPQETRHDLFGTNVCDVLRNKYVNPETEDRIYTTATTECNIDPFVPSWNRYMLSINLESDMKNVFRKISCDESALYIPSTNSVMYSKAPMKRDNTIESGYYVNQACERNNGRTPNFFMEDTRQTRMGL